MTELRGKDEPPLQAMLDQLGPVDIVLVEGYKRDAHPKVEAFRQEAKNPLIANNDPTVRAVAANCSIDLDLPTFDLDDTKAIAQFILDDLGL